MLASSFFLKRPPRHCPKVSRSETRPTHVSSTLCTVALLLTTVLFVGLLQSDDADARRKKRRRVQPPLKILSINLVPESYVAGDGSLDFSIEVAIPPDADGGTLLEVSSLISSPSKRHIRFLAVRKPIGDFQDPSVDTHSGGAESSPESENTPRSRKGKADRRLVTLSWDGTDQNRRVVGEGRYDYVIRAKLFTVIEDRAQTQMVSWKKKGKLQVRSADPLTSAEQEPDSQDVPDPAP